MCLVEKKGIEFYKKQVLVNENKVNFKGYIIQLYNFNGICV